MVNAPSSPTSPAPHSADAIDGLASPDAVGPHAVKANLLNGGQHSETDSGVTSDSAAVKSANLPPPDVAASIPCRFFPLGQCKYGDACAFSHRATPSPTPAETPAASEVSQATPSDDPNSVSMASGSGGQSQQGTTPVSQQPSPSPNGLAHPMALPMPPVTAMDYNGYPMAAMPPPYYYYGMPQPYYGAPMPYAPPGYIDANGEYRAMAAPAEYGRPMPAYGMPYAQPYPDPAYVSSMAPSPPTAPSPVGHEALSMSQYDPRLSEVYPSVTSEMPYSPAMTTMPQLHPALMPHQNVPYVPQPLPQHQGHERRYSNTPAAAYSQARPMGRSQPPPLSSSSSGRRGSATNNGDLPRSTASAITSISSSNHHRDRSFPAHSRYATEPNSRASTNTASAMTRVGGNNTRGWPCVFFPENRCRNGDSCLYSHILPDGEDARALGKGMIGVDGRTSNPAESSKSFVFPLRGRGGGFGRGGGRGGGLGRSWGGSGGPRSYGGGHHHQHPSMGSMASNGDDLASQLGEGFQNLRLGGDSTAEGGESERDVRDRIERFVASTRSSSVPSRTANGYHHPPPPQRVPNVGDFPALETPVSPRTTAAAPLPAVSVAEATGDEAAAIAASPPGAAVAKLTASFASAAAKGLAPTNTTGAPSTAISAPDAALAQPLSVISA